MCSLVSSLRLILSISLACLGCAPSEPSAGGDGQIALVGGAVYASAGEAPIRNALVLIDGQTIRHVGKVGHVQVPPGAMRIDVTGSTILPAFWNSHVHFTEPKWSGIDSVASSRVSELLADMFTGFGFVHVFDVGSFTDRTPTLRARIENGGVLGPDIMTTLTPFVPPNGTPTYVAPLKLPELLDAASAKDSVSARIRQGADGLKLFTVPMTRSEPFPVMSLPVIRAVAEAAHRHGRPVFAHPTNLAGVEVAVAGGVDILAHSAPMAGTFSDSLLSEMRRDRVAMIPTLTLWEDDYGRDTVGMRQFVQTGQDQVRAYAERGGRILFGTDVGYLDRYDPTREYQLLAGAGLDFPEILRSLTIAPAAQFGWRDRAGRIAPGLDADIVVVDGDPAQDILALARVRLTIKRGRILFRSATQEAPP